MSNIKEAAEVALGVLNSTRHTLLVGEAATRFAESLGYSRTDIGSKQSVEIWKQWKSGNCQPNFRVPYFWSPNPRANCGPYEYKTSRMKGKLRHRCLRKLKEKTKGLLIVKTHFTRSSALQTGIGHRRGESRHNWCDST